MQEKRDLFLLQSMTVVRGFVTYFNNVKNLLRILKKKVNRHEIPWRF